LPFKNKNKNKKKAMGCVTIWCYYHSRSVGLCGFENITFIELAFMSSRFLYNQLAL